MFGLIRKKKVRKLVDEEVNRVFEMRAQSTRPGDNFWDGAVWSLEQVRNRILK
jgi:uncharacterized protein with PIN domain